MWDEDRDPARLFTSEDEAREFIKTLSERSEVKKDSILLMEIKPTPLPVAVTWKRDPTTSSILRSLSIRVDHFGGRRIDTFDATSVAPSGV